MAAKGGHRCSGLFKFSPIWTSLPSAGGVGAFFFEDIKERTHYWSYQLPVILIFVTF
jgi:hypothetical protein